MRAVAPAGCNKKSSEVDDYIIPQETHPSSPSSSSDWRMLGSPTSSELHWIFFRLGNLGHWPQRLPGLPSGIRPFCQKLRINHHPTSKHEPKPNRAKLHLPTPRRRQGQPIRQENHHHQPRGKINKFNSPPLFGNLSLSFRTPHTAHPPHTNHPPCPPHSPARSCAAPWCRCATSSLAASRAPPLKTHKRLPRPPRTPLATTRTRPPRACHASAPLPVLPFPTPLRASRKLSAGSVAAREE